MDATAPPSDDTKPTRRSALRAGLVTVGIGLAGCMQPLLDEAGTADDDQPANATEAQSQRSDTDNTQTDDGTDSQTDDETDAEEPNAIELTPAWDGYELDHTYADDGRIVGRNSPDTISVSRSGDLVWASESSDPDEYSVWPRAGSGITQNDSSVFVQYVSFGGIDEEFPARIYSFDAATGTEQWRHETEADRVRGMASTDDRLYYGVTPFDRDTDREVRALDLDTREIEWTRPLSAVDISALWRDDETLYVATNALYALDPATGEIQREHDIAWAESRTDTTVYYDRGRQVEAFDLDTERVQWTVEIDRRANEFTIGDGAIYAGHDGGYVAAHDSDDGTQLWEYRLDSEVRDRPIVDAGIVWVTDTIGNVVALDATDGAELYHRELEDSDSVAVVDGRIYLPEPYNQAYDIERTD